MSVLLSLCRTLKFTRKDRLWLSGSNQHNLFNLIALNIVCLKYNSGQDERSCCFHAGFWTPLVRLRTADAAVRWKLARCCVVQSAEMGCCCWELPVIVTCFMHVHALRKTVRSPVRILTLERCWVRRWLWATDLDFYSEEKQWWIPSQRCTMFLSNISKLFKVLTWANLSCFGCKFESFSVFLEERISSYCYSETDVIHVSTLEDAGCWYRLLTFQSQLLIHIWATVSIYITRNRRSCEHAFWLFFCLKPL